MNERQMISAYDRWEEAKREGRQIDAEVAKAEKRLRGTVEDEALARQALETANNNADHSRRLAGATKPAQVAALAEAERALERATEARAEAKAALADLRKRETQARIATEATLMRARNARVEYASDAVEQIQAALRSDKSLQARLNELYRAKDLATDS